MGGGVTFWDTVVINLAPIIIALTGFGGMVGAFLLQYRSTKRMFEHQNQKIDTNANEAASQRDNINQKLDKVNETTNGMAVRNEQIARNLGVAEGRALGKQDNVNDPPIV
jgi:hypothetical protein